MRRPCPFSLLNFLLYFFIVSSAGWRSFHQGMRGVLLLVEKGEKAGGGKAGKRVLLQWIVHNSILCSWLLSSPCMHHHSSLALQMARSDVIRARLKHMGAARPHVLQLCVKGGRSSVRAQCVWSAHMCLCVCVCVCVCILCVYVLCVCVCVCVCVV